MHLQIRTTPATSPADLRAFLAVLEAAHINIEAAGGSDVEKGGEFAFAVEHGKEAAAMTALREKGYAPRLVDHDHGLEDGSLADSPGELLRFIEKVAAKNAASGLVIKDVSIGVPDRDGRIQVQAYSEKP